MLAVDRANLIQRRDRRGQAAVDAENFVVDDCSEGQVVEHFCAVAPNVDTAVLAQALVIKSVDLCNLTTFVVSSNQCNSILIPYFKS